MRIGLIGSKADDVDDAAPSAREHRGQSFPHACARAATLKNAIEALGVPHTEVGRVEVNGEPAPLARLVAEGDRIEVHPWGREPLPERPRFIADEIDLGVYGSRGQQRTAVLALKLAEVHWMREKGTTPPFLAAPS